MYVLDSPLRPPLARSSFVFLLVWDPLLHTRYTSQADHFVLFTIHAHNHRKPFCCSTEIMSSVLNLSLSEAILLGTRQRAHSYSSLATVNVAGSQIPLADHIKILGVTLDKNLSMNNHDNAVCKSIHSHTRALRHIRSSISEDMAKMVVCAFVSSRLDYANSVLFGATQKNISNCLLYTSPSPRDGLLSRMPSSA